MGSKAIFAGGFARSSGWSDAVDIYDADTGLWTTASLSAQRGRLTATRVGNKAIFAGGQDAAGFSNVVDIFTEIFAGDVDDDGFVGQGDLDIVLGEWGRTGAEIVDPRADVDADEFVGQGDLDTVLNDWGQGTPPPPVPEPATLSLLALASLALMRRKRKLATPHFSSHTSAPKDNSCVCVTATGDA